MTICIAAKADDEKSVVLAADTMVTYGTLAYETDGAEKIISLSDKIYMMLAGNESLGREVYKRASRSAPATVSVEEWAKLVQKVFIKYKNEIAETIILRPQGLDFDKYISSQQTLHKDLAVSIYNTLKDLKLDTTLIVAGVDEDSIAHIFTIVGNGEMNEVPVFECSGAGFSHAANSLLAREYKTSRDSKEATYLVYEAKRRSEVAPGVGQGTTMVVIKDIAKRLTDDDIKELSDAYENVKEASQKALEKVLKPVSEPTKESEVDKKKDEQKTIQTTD